MASMTDRQSLFSLGTVSEWVFGVVAGLVFLGGMIWGTATIVSDLKSDIQTARHETATAVSDIKHSVSSIAASIESDRRISDLERKEAVNEMRALVQKEVSRLDGRIDANRAEQTARIDRNWTNVDNLWELVRDNQGGIKGLRRVIGQ